MAIDTGNSDSAGPGRIATVQDFARELTRARNGAGRTVREVARDAGLALSTTGDYFAGRHLPQPGADGPLPRILAACGETDPGQVAAWLQALARVRRAPGRRPASAVPPYRGLGRFQPQDAGWFFGREDLTEILLAEATRPDAPQIPLIVVGASGSGKSSLLRAGLMAALQAGRGRDSGGADRVLLLTPGAAPLAVLPGPLAAPGGTIIVDQFEEVFTSCDDEAERRAFIDALGALCGQATVVLGLRADCYAAALQHPLLAAALQRRQVVVSPMTVSQLSRAVTEPARKAGLSVEDGLLELLLADLRPEPAPADGDAAHEPGALPLLSHALLATWEHSRGGGLTVAGYQSAGGIRNAIARTAETVYGSLSAEQQALARSLFLRLVQVTENGAEVRCRVPAADLADAAGGPGAAGGSREILARFVAERLVTVGSQTAEITHEALLAAWPRLRQWIDGDRAGLRTRRRVLEAAQNWQESGRDDSALLRGAQLMIATDWAADSAHRASLGARPREFLDAAIARDAAERRAGARRNRQLRRMVAGLVVLVLAASGLAGYALRQRQVADVARAQSDARGTAIEADQIRGQDVSLASQLSLAAYRIARTPDAVASLLESSGTPAATRLTDSAAVVQAVALSHDHRLLAVPAADGTLRLWRISRPGHPAPAGRLLDRPAEPLYTAAFSPDGKVLAAAGASGRVWLWRLSRGGAPARLPSLAGMGGTVYSVAISPGGGLLAVGDAADHVWLWDIADPGHARLLARLGGPTQPVYSVAFSPDGLILAAGSADATVRLWSLGTPARPRPLGRPLTGPTQIVTSVAFSPSGQTLAAGSRDDSVWLWNLSRPGRPAPARGPLKGATDWVNAAAFSPDGSMLAAGSSDDTVRVWDAATGALLATLPQPEPVTSLAWDGAGRLVAGGADGTVRLWELPSPVLAAGGPANSVAFAPGGRTLAIGGPQLELWNRRSRTMTAAASLPGTFVNAVAFQPPAGSAAAGTSVLAAGYGTGRLQLWRAAGGRLAKLSPQLSGTATGMIEFLAFSPDGRILASAADDGTVRLWDVADPAAPHLLATIADSGTFVFSVAFRRGGSILAAGSADDKVRLWNVARPARPVAIGRPLTGPSSYVYAVAFSPDGDTLAVGSADKTVRLWDVAHPGRPVRLGRPLAGPASYVYSVAFSPDGRTLAAGVTDGTVWLWNMGSPAQPAFEAQLTGPAGHVYSVAFSPDGGSLAAASADGTVRLWDTRAAAAADAVCSAAGQPLSRTEWARYLPGRRYAPPCPR